MWTALGAPVERQKEVRHMVQFARRFIDDDSGVTAIEYGMLAAALAAGVTALVGAPDDAASILGQLQAKFDGILS